MEIDTSSIESSRKNLVVLSMGFILFSLGEAVLGDDKGSTTLSILAGSITFNNPEVLVNLAWIMLGWFLLRFWQFSNHKHDWTTYTKEINKTKLFSFYAKSKEIEHVHTQDINFQPLLGTWIFPTAGATTSHGNIKIEKHEYFKKISLLFWVAFTSEGFGQYYFPYCMFIAAISVSSW